MGRLSWVIWLACYDHKGPYKKATGGVRVTQEDDVVTEAEMGVTDLGDGGGSHQVQKYR